jgi:ribosome maturation factor RimP
MGAVAERVERALAPAVAEQGLDLELVEVQPAGRRRLIRVLVDRDGGVNLDDVAALSHHLSEVLDASDAMGDQPYVLEVSSPGVDRPLTLPRHWRRSRGRLVVVELVDGQKVSGRVKTTTDDAATLFTETGMQPVTFADVVNARIEVEFSHPQTDDVTSEE